MKRFLILFSLFIFLSKAGFVFAQINSTEIKPPEKKQNIEENIPTNLNVEDLPGFFFKPSNEEESFYNTHKIPLDTRLRIVVDSPIDIKKSVAGDYFKASVLEDFYLPTQNPRLLALKNSWIRGTVSFIKKPSLINMSAKINIHLDSITSPTGEILPISTNVSLEKGFLNNKGLFDPLFTGNNSDSEKSLYSLPAYLEIPLKQVSLNYISKFLNGNLLGLFLENKDHSLYKGQEIQLVIKNEVKITVN